MFLSFLFLLGNNGIIAAGWSNISSQLLEGSGFPHSIYLPPSVPPLLPPSPRQNFAIIRPGLGELLDGGGWEEDAQTRGTRQVFDVFQIKMMGYYRSFRGGEESSKKHFL